MGKKNFKHPVSAIRNGFLIHDNVIIHFDIHITIHCNLFQDSCHRDILFWDFGDVNISLGVTHFRHSQCIVFFVVWCVIAFCGLMRFRIDFRIYIRLSAINAEHIVALSKRTFCSKYTLGRLDSCVRHCLYQRSGAILKTPKATLWKQTRNHGFVFRLKSPKDNCT